MSKVKYYYDNEKLNYQKIEVSPLKKTINILVFLAASSLIGFIIFVLFIKFLETPKENELEMNIKELNQEINYLTTWFNNDYNQSKKILKEIQNKDNTIYRQYFGVDPIPTSVSNAGFGGADKYQYLEKMSNAKLMIKIKQQIDQISKQIDIEYKSLQEISLIAKNKTDMLNAIPAIQPVSNKDLKRVVSGFGVRIHPITKTRKKHEGMDFTASIGTPIYATGDGEVEKSQYNRSGYGRYVVINHGYGYKTLYAHMSKSAVEKGQKVKRGEIIGYVGSTGLSAGPHLHYEVHKESIDKDSKSIWKPVNPAFYCYQKLNPQDYQRLIEMAATSNQSFD